MTLFFKAGMMSRVECFIKCCAAYVVVAYCLCNVGSVWAQTPTTSPSTPQTSEESLPGLNAVLPDLRRGGFVIYFRHAATSHTGMTDDAANLNRCDKQRNLSSEGRRQATEIGQAFRMLNIPVGTVTTSPYCRCKDTGQLAFGRYTVSRALYFAMMTNATETKEITALLRGMLSTPPAVGTNAIIVSHTANLQEAAGIWPKPEGVAYVFRPLSDGRFEVVAKILPQDWMALAKLISHSSS